MAVYEFYGTPSNSKVYEYKVNSYGYFKKTSVNEHTSAWQHFTSFFYNVFLPQGYPDSVSSDYLRYQIWDTIQAFCSSITSALAMQAVLKGSGVGDETASAAGATFTWLLKDGTGMVGRIAFAYMHGTSLDANAKQWRLFADVLNDGAMFIQMFAPLLPKSYFTFVMCLAGLAFALVGVAGGCTRAALTMHQAKRNNMADVAAKDGSQETLVNLAALITSLVITPIVSGHTLITWSLFFIFSFGHIYANYKAVSSIVMEIFNKIRFFAVAKSYEFEHGRVLSPNEANQQESVFFPPSFDWLNLGCKLDDLQLTDDEFHLQISKNFRQKFLLKCDQSSGKVNVALSHDATAEDIIRACYQSYSLRQSYLLGQKLLINSSAGEEEFMDALKKQGWNLTIQHLGANEWRWSPDRSFLKKVEDKYV